MATPYLNPAVIEAGELLDGKYRFERELGRGAMGTVWTAVHESLGQRVAIKIISPEHAGSTELRARFEREARAAAQLRSRFVVSVFDHGTTESGLPYIVMEYLEGETLEERVNREGCLSIKDACRVTRHVARGLAAAHARGIVHRDLKPGNIFLVRSEDDDESDWTAKVLDFGVAKMEDFSERSTTRTGTVLGTPLYMSPEQVRGASNVDARADLYSLGMVLYNMLTGTFAFDGESFGDLLISICTDDLPRLSSRAPHVSAALDAWFAKACARDPAMRFQSAEELIRALDRSLGAIEGDRPSSDSTSSDSLALMPQLAETFVSPNDTSRGGTAPALLDTSGATLHGSESDGGAAVTIGHKTTHSRLPLFLAAALFGLGARGAGFLVFGRGAATPELPVESSHTATPPVIVEPRAEAQAPKAPAEPSGATSDSAEAKGPSGATSDAAEAKGPNEGVAAAEDSAKDAAATATNKKPAQTAPKKATPRASTPKATPTQEEPAAPPPAPTAPPVVDRVGF